jgi:small conductance mechanosensitive channel
MRPVLFLLCFPLRLAILVMALVLPWWGAHAQETVEPAGPTIEIGEGVITDAEIRSRIQTIFHEIEGLAR